MRIDWAKLLNSLYFRRQKLAELSADLVSPAYVKIYLAIVLALNFINWLFAYYFNNQVSQDLVVLHYNVSLGVNLIGSASKVYTVPAIGLIFFIINFVLLLNIQKQGRFIIHLLLSAAALSQFFLLAGTAAIYLVNFR